MLSVPILYEDDDVLVINKPAGLVVHSDGRTKEPTVVDWILERYPTLRNVGEPLQLTTANQQPAIHLRPGIVHRLDRETSGTLLIAKNQTSFARLKKQFQRQQVHKIYHAFVYGNVKHKEGIIDRPIARSGSNPILWSSTRGKKGEEREAVTEYRVISRFKDKTGLDFSFLELRPHTGRTHQIRVHLKAINYPVVCDKLYAPPRLLSESRWGGWPKKERVLGFSRLALHSRSISFTHPSTGKNVMVEAPYPKDFEETLKIFKYEA